MKKALKFFSSGFLLLALQGQIVPQLPYAALRIDLLLSFMFAVAVEWSPMAGLLWAGSLGFVVDVFSGEFWGLHVGSYVVTVCLVNMASENFDCCNPAYQLGLVGLCGLGQSIALGLFLSYVPTDSATLTSIWVSLCIRTLLSATIAPLLIYPLLSQETING
ncbi:MAG: rod shape-determining protein MreD [Syntrophobacteraceae bacterium]|nr:rod shape-determining protein MreD [Syntrophobacteraceae bacterium]